VKKAIAIIVSVIFVLSLAGLSFATDKAAPMSIAKAEKSMEKKAPAKIRRVTGNVMSFDASSITVKGRKGNVTATISDKTKVKMNKEKKTLADVKVGDKVTLRYAEADGSNTARTIYMRAAKPADK